MISSRPYVADLGNVVDPELAEIRPAGLNHRRRSAGGAAIHYWHPIIDRYGLKATVVNEAIDPTFRFMTVDWDGKIRMDCSSPYAMAEPDRKCATALTSPSPTTPTPTATAS